MSIKMVKEFTLMEAERKYKMATVIIPYEYIIDGDGKDKAIDVKDIYGVFWQSTNNTLLLYDKTEKMILINLQVYEVCTLIADALKGS